MATTADRPDAADLRHALDVSLGSLTALPDRAWDCPAAGLEWTCRETAAHVLGVLAGYAMQLSGTGRRFHPYPALAELHPHPGRPGVWFWPEEAGGTGAIVQCIDDVGGLLVAVVATVPPDRTGQHPSGHSDRTGFAAMGMAEVLLHTHDILAAHDVPPAVAGEVVSPVLSRVLPDAPRSTDAWGDLLRATGRTEETRGRRWQWDPARRTRARR